MSVNLRKLVLPAAMSLAVAAAAPAVARKHHVEPIHIAAPPAGMGQVVFFRPASRVMGRFIDLPVRDGDAGIGKLANGAYFVHVAEPGTHMFSTRLKVVTRLPLEVEAGETYYVEQTMGVGLVAGPPHLTPVDAGEFQRLKLKPSRKVAKDLKPRRSKP